MEISAVRAFAASSTREILDAAEELSQALHVPGTSTAYAIQLMESAALRSIGGLDELEARGYDQPASGGWDETQSPHTDDVLAIALSQLNLATALSAAEQAVRAAEDPNATGSQRNLDAALADLRASSSVLSQPMGPEERQGYEARPVPRLDNADAVANCRLQVKLTMDVLTEKTAGVALEGFTAAKDWAPKQIQEAFTILGQKLKLGDHVRGMVRLAVRALDRALDLLSRLIPPDSVAGARRRVQRLWSELESGAIGQTVVANVFDATATKQRAAMVLSAANLNALRVQRTTGALKDLSTTFTGHAQLASAVVGGIASVSALFGLLNLAIPHLGLISAGAVLFVVATIMLIGMDYSDVGIGLQRTKGVRVLVEELSV